MFKEAYANSAKIRFMEKVTITEGCWPFSSSKERYASFHLNGAPELAHRASYMLFVGPIPEGKLVLHECDNTKCVRPDHLFIGNQAENVQDMFAKGRANRSPRIGSSNSMAALTEDDVIEIKRLLSTGLMLQREIAAKYRVSRATIGLIKTGKTWGHV